MINNNGEITYSEFHKTINQIANLLIQKGMKPGERVAVQAEKSNLQIALYAATLKAGGVYLPLNTGYTLSELEYFLTSISERLLFFRTIAATTASPKSLCGEANTADSKIVSI